MIYTITLNPSLDYLMMVDEFNLGETNRSTQEILYPGGKGFNCSQVLNTLHVSNQALGFAAGFSGKKIEELLLEKQVNVRMVWVKEGFSRINVKLKGHVESEINGRGPQVDAQAITEFKALLDQWHENDLVMICGSLANGTETLYEDLLTLCDERKIRFVVDVSSEALMAALAYRPWLIKPNLAELEKVSNRSLTTREEQLTAMTQLQNLGARNVLLSMGKEGALLLSEDGKILMSSAPKGMCINSVGSGDSMVSGFVSGYLQSQSYEEALRLGTACGSATAFSEDLATLDEITACIQCVEIRLVDKA